jgi:hypothetical protein
MLRRVTSFSHAVAAEPRGATPFLAGALMRPAAATERREVGRLITKGPKAKGGDIGAENPIYRPSPRCGPLAAADSRRFNSLVASIQAWAAKATPSS